MKRFGYFLVLFFAIAGFFAPVGVQVTSPDSSHSLGDRSLVSLSLTLEPHVADAFVSSYCTEKEKESPFGGIKCGTVDAIFSFFEVIWFQVTQVIAAIMAVLVDFFLLHSISSSSYKSGIIEAGWEILRDFVNIIFIFALLMISFNIVLGRNDSKNKSALLKTLLVALVINFSLFITYAVVDSSNIFARVFYNKIEAGTEFSQNPNYDSPATQEIDKFFTGFTGVRSPSVAILSAFNPQKLLGEGGSSDSIGFFGSLVIIFFAGLLNILIIYVFLSVMLLFLGRTVGIILLGIFAPLAFASLTVPGMDNIQWVGFTNWWKQLVSLAFMAPVYLLLLYLTATFATNKGIMASVSNIGTGSTSFLTAILGVTLPFVLVAILLMTSLKVTKTLAGELGNMIVDFTKKGIGGAVAAGALVATGGMAAAGMGMRAGAGAARLVPGGKGTAFANRLSRGGDKMMSFKADVTKIPGFGKLVGGDMSKTVGAVTGKSVRGHIDTWEQKSKNPILSNEYSTLKKKRDDDYLKIAKDDAEAAKKKAEAPREAELYQLRIDEALAQKDPVYISTMERVAEAAVELKKAQEAEKSSLKKLQDLQKAGAPAADIRNAKADWNANRADASTKKATHSSLNTALESTAGYRAGKDREDFQKNKERIGDEAASDARREVAARVKVEDPELANRIIKGDDPQNQTKKKVEELIKKIEETP